MGFSLFSKAFLDQGGAQLRTCEGSGRQYWIGQALHLGYLLDRYEWEKVRLSAMQPQGGPGLKNGYASTAGESRIMPWRRMPGPIPGS